MRTDDLYLVDILDALEAINSFLHGISFDVFLHNKEKQSAILWNLMIIGEASSRLSIKTRNQMPEQPWSGIRKFRNLLVHGYFVLKWEEVWRMVTIEIPPLKEQVEQILKLNFPATYQQWKIQTN